MGYYSQQEIAEAVGYAKGPVSEFLNSLRASGNGTEAKNEQSPENPELADHEYDEEETNGKGLGVCRLDKRLLIKANHPYCQINSRCNPTLLQLIAFITLTAP